MKVVSYEHEGAAGFGLAEGDGVIALSGRLNGIATLQQLLAEGVDWRRIEDGFAQRAADLPLGEVRFLPPVLQPAKIVCVGLNYRGHMVETGRAPVEHPTLFSRWADSHVAHGEPIFLPRASGKFDFEGELAVVVGRSGRHIAKRDAMSHVAGYSCYNDGSIRDWQRHTSQFLPGKNFEASGSFGPWLATAGADVDPARFRLTTRLNGVVLQEAKVEDLIFDIPSLIAYISTFTTLNPGDVIVTGTPDGVGAFRDPQVWMGEGDVVEVDIDGVGTLTNTVASESAASVAAEGAGADAR